MLKCLLGHDWVYLEQVSERDIDKKISDKLCPREGRYGDTYYSDMLYHRECLECGKVQNEIIRYQQKQEERMTKIKEKFGCKYVTPRRYK